MTPAAAPRSPPTRSGTPGSSPAGRCGPETRSSHPPATAPDPPCDTSAPADSSLNGSGHKPLRRQLRPVQIPARHARSPDVDLPDHPDRHRLAAAHPARRAAVFAIGRPIGLRAACVRSALNARQVTIVVSVGPYMFDQLAACSAYSRTTTAARAQLQRLAPQITTRSRCRCQRSSATAPAQLEGTRQLAARSPGPAAQQRVRAPAISAVGDARIRHAATMAATIPIAPDRDVKADRRNWPARSALRSNSNSLLHQLSSRTTPRCSIHHPLGLTRRAGGVDHVRQSDCGAAPQRRGSQDRSQSLSDHTPLLDPAHTPSQPPDGSNR